jgi:hypothetical protein
MLLRPPQRLSKLGIMRIDPLRFAVLLPTLLVAHNIADHVAQTDHQAAIKANSWRAMAGHVSSYQLTQLIAVETALRASGMPCPRRAKITGALISTITHAVLDRRWPVKMILERTRSPQFAGMTIPLNGMYLAGQALHHGFLFVAALAMAS